MKCLKRISEFLCSTAIYFFAPLWRMGPLCSSAETQVCYRSSIIAARNIMKKIPSSQNGLRKVKGVIITATLGQEYSTKWILEQCRVWLFTSTNILCKEKIPIIFIKLGGGGGKSPFSQISREKTGVCKGKMIICGIVLCCIYRIFGLVNKRLFNHSI